ncbi:MAG: histidine kinase, partial [Ruaniaceae bacterium]|nr:histidine kinase [Ruaniaceae bacterium]
NLTGLDGLLLGFGTGGDTQTNATIYLLLATITGAVGLALRLATARRRRLEEELRLELATRAEHEREAVLAERRAIAGELHDSIAHHLTIVALHSQLLDDDAMRTTSQDAIQVATRKALSDLRFVIELAEDAPDDRTVSFGRLAEAVDEARIEVQAAGHATVCEGNSLNESIPRGVEIILTRIVRESATNILKHAGPGEVRCGYFIDDDSISLKISSPLPTTPRRDLPSTGTGLNRMAERVLGVSGEFTAGPHDGQWVITVRLPIAAKVKGRATPSE